MRERPILFSGPMVRAILDGRKTQTRRVVKPIPGNALVNLRDAEGRADLYSGQHDDPGSWGYQFLDDGAPADLASWAHILCPYGQPGDRLWVRETWMPGYDHEADHEDGPKVSVLYRADNTEACISAPSYELAERWEREFSDDGYDVPPWRPSIHMPRWACRLVLEVTGVRVERLQAVSEANAAAEGVTAESIASYQGASVERPAGFAFRDLWLSINGAESWDANPWVWVVEFRRAQQQGGTP